MAHGLGVENTQLAATENRLFTPAIHAPTNQRRACGYQLISTALISRDFPSQTSWSKNRRRCQTHCKPCRNTGGAPSYGPAGGRASGRRITKTNPPAPLPHSHALPTRAHPCTRACPAMRRMHLASEGL